MTVYTSPAGLIGTQVRVRGLVQGVGFRPFVWRIANEDGLTGHVLNDAEGVLAEVWGDERATHRFLERLTTEHPPLSRIDEVIAAPLPPRSAAPPHDFTILSSVSGDVATGIVPDTATCPDCLTETLNPRDRRHGYAFTNCTHCGPRLSIIEGIPYDRARTSMASFTMCPACQAEYDHPADRRFHAQPNACPVCGPRLWAAENGQDVETADPIRWAAGRLAEGAILAIKGIGGFHLAADATQSQAVDRLRTRKHRPHKPLALMVRDVAQARRICRVSAEEEDLLRDRAAPIVLLTRRADAGLAEGLAPDQDQLGVMLPYTPLHHLLMAAVPGPIVLTSGNLSEEPQVTSNSAAGDKLGEIADGYLLHDRAIVNRLDDSVVRVSRAGPVILRRARGYAPAPLDLHEAFTNVPKVLAMGGELKATFCLIRNGQAISSQHIGDLETALALKDFKKNLDLYRQIYRFDPEVIAVDRHPDYLSTQLGKTLAAETGAACVEVQHHHAHLAGCLAEAKIPPDDDRSLGLILDGSGLGVDGTIWGGEILLGGYRSFERAAHFQPVLLPGGAAAIREPWRNLVAHLHTAFGPDYRTRLNGTDLPGLLERKRAGILDQMLEKRLNAPLSSSAGRLFDAVAAALGVHADRQSFEGQTGMALETLARPFLRGETGYPVDVTERAAVVVSWAPFWSDLIADLRKGVDPGRIAARFHLALIEGLTALSLRLADQHGIRRVVLSGGVMQNSHLADGLHAGLSEHGLNPLLPRHLPANDGGLSLGQAAVAGVNNEA